MSEVPTAPAQLVCPQCQASIGYYDVQGSSYYACPQCHTYFKQENEQPPVVFGCYEKVPPEKPFVPLGTLGTLAGRPWRVLAFVVRNERNGPQYRWTEYQLFQPDTGDYAQLAQYQHHWMLIRPAEIPYQARAGRDRAFGPEGSYQLYHRYQARVQYAEGEFDWDIEGDDEVQIAEYISPPVMVVSETRGLHTSWYRGDYLTPEDLAQAFGLPRTILPRPRGVGAIEPSPYPHWPVLRQLTLVALALLLLLQLGTWMLRPSQMLLQEMFVTRVDSTAAPGTSRVIVSPSFELREQAALNVAIRADLDNQWLELPISLVNETTGRGYEFTRTVEYYHGYEDGESWTEGDHEGEAVLSRVPAGRYHLNLYPFSENLQSPNLQPLQITIVVTANPTLTANFLLVLALLLLYPAWQLWQRQAHESQRWEASNFSPR